MDLDALLLSRLQFAFTISFHIIFPSISIGLAAYLAVLEGLWLTTGRRTYKRLYDFWIKLFAVAFALGVVSGVVMSYQFGTNWSRFSEATANILGPLLGYEVLAAFFLEASFLGIMLFGGRLVGRGLHFLATCIVALGTLISAFWILSANSWMQSPAGYELREGIFHATDWLEVVFNPTFPYRLVHMVLAAYIATAFLVAGVGAWLLIRRRARSEALTMMRMGLGLACILVPLQIVAGHEHGLSVYRTQPAKHAAIEGHWQTWEGNAPLILFALPDQEGARNMSVIEVPEIGSLLATGSFDGTVYGLNEWAPEDRPHMATVFWAFRFMVGIGLVMLLLAPFGAWGAWRGWIARSRIVLSAYVLMIPSGIVAILAGWVTAEAGRQPFTVYGLMRTSESVSPVGGGQIAVSLALFVVIYLIVFTFGMAYMARIAGAGPNVPRPPEPEPETFVLAPAMHEPTGLADDDGPDDAPDDADEETAEEEPGDDEPDETDELTDEELERLTAPDEDDETAHSDEPDDIDEDDAEEATGGKDDGDKPLSAHERLFLTDKALGRDDDTEKR